MAVYAGARRRSTLMPGRPTRVAVRGSTAADDRPLPRRRARVSTRAGRRPSRIGFALGGIALAFLLGLFSLAQTVRVSATSYDIDRLIYERERLMDDRQELLSDLSRLGSEPAIRKLALDDARLSQLADPLVVPAR
jgi:hypothetical protein